MTRKLMMAALVLALAATFAHADEKKGLYIGAGAGYGSQELSVSTGNFQDNTTAYKGFVGYRFMRFIGFEAAYVDFGNASDTLDFGGGTTTDVTLKTKGETAEITGTIPIGSFLEIYGKAGYLWWNAKSDDSTNSDSNSGSDPVYGGGVKLIFAKKFGVRLEYEQFDIQDTKKVYLITAGIEWRF
jgi:OOP family OmpA-OmpF porin